MNPKRAEELVDSIDQIYRKYLSEYVDDAPADKIEAYREEAAALLLAEMCKEREGEWERGYFCAVVKLILSEGRVDYLSAQLAASEEKVEAMREVILNADRIMFGLHEDQTVITAEEFYSWKDKSRVALAEGKDGVCQ